MVEERVHFLSSLLDSVFFLISFIPSTFLHSPNPCCYPSASLSTSSPVSPLFSLRGFHLDLHRPPPGATLISDRGWGWVEIGNVVSSHDWNDFSTAGCWCSGGRMRKAASSLCSTSFRLMKKNWCDAKFPFWPQNLIFLTWGDSSGARATCLLI